MKPTTRLHSFLIASSSLLAITSASAQTNGTWLGNANWWSDPASWSSGQIATGTGGTANFTGVNIAGDINKPLGSAGQNRTIGNIIFTDATTSSHNLTLSGNILTLDVTSGQPNIDVTQSDRTLTISSVVAGNEGLQKSGLGSLTLSGNNTFTGNIAISAGTLNASLTQGGNNPTSGALGNPSTAGREVTIASGATLNFNNIDVLGQGGTNNTLLTLIANGGTIRNIVNGVNTLGPVQLNGGTLTSTATTVGSGFRLNGTVTVGGSAVSTISASTGTGTIVSSGVITYDVADAAVGNDLNVTAVVAGFFGAGGITKTGTGTMTLTNVNTYTGLTRVDNGTLTLAHATNTIADTGAVNVNGGTLALGTNTDTVGAVTLTSGSITGTGAGTLTGTGSAYDVRSGSISAKLGGTVGLTKTTGGTVTISSDNSVGGYSGATAVNQGTLVVNGNITTSVTTVAIGATLGGTGTVGTLTVNGIIAPGNSIGTLNALGDVTWNDNDAWVFELGTAAASLALANTGSSTQDLLNITGAGNDFLKGTGSTFTFNFANTGAIGFYKLVDWTSTSDFVAGDFVASNLSSGLSGSFTVDGPTSALYLTVIPEPGAALLGSLGLLALLRRRRN